MITRKILSNYLKYFFISMKKLIVSSSSYLIPNHYAWDKPNNFKISFKNSGNLSDGFFKSDLEVDLFINISQRYDFY